MNLTAPQLLLAFQNLTGIRLKYVSHGHQAQAIAFCSAGFTLTELEQVIRWIQKEIGRGKLDERSLSWRNVFGEYGSGNEFATFQDRLSFAQKTVRTRPEQRQVPVSNGHVTVLADPPMADAQEAGPLIAEQLAQFRKEMSA